ncbi:hypothetical protein GGX14DRAFT_608455 [Mycena pura]|uniref:Uncharacterized protein n=1 Tax=Mycena pura TaxID=153505 RepID=A0AAD6YI79_9AGAR|nr:hypothetical protein GGX14DRAFT_608455 [Mycena pura]
MSMPDPSRPGPGHQTRDPDRPGLQTRGKNNRKVLEKAGLIPTQRRTHAEVEASKADAQAKDAAAAQEQQDKLLRLAQIEDDLAMQDQVSSPAGGRKAVQRRKQATASSREFHPEEDNDDDSVVSQEYQPDSDNSNNESGNEGDENDARPKKIVRRDDVEGFRKTKDKAGDRAKSAPTNTADKKRKGAQERDIPAKKAKSSKKGGLVPSAVRSRATSSASSNFAMGEVDDEDSLVKYGGPAMDDDKNEEVEAPRQQKKGLPKSEYLAIAPAKPLTATAIRGGSRKWTLNHLAPGTADLFSRHLVPLAREEVATKPAWKRLSVLDVQNLVDIVYGEGQHAVTEKSAWYGLIGYRISDWQGGFASLAKIAVHTMMTPPLSKDEQDVRNASLVDDSALDKDATGTAGEEAADGDVDETPPFDFTTKAGRAEFVAWALQKHMKHGKETGTQAFQWRMWNDGLKRSGFMMSYPIVYTFSHHLQTLREVPDQYPSSGFNRPPYGALIYSSQAVQRELEFWASGDYVAPDPKDKDKQFSSDNWGDYRTKVNGIVTEHRRASKYLGPLEKWGEDKWNELYVEAEKHLDARQKGRKGRRGHSRCLGQCLERKMDVSYERRKTSCPPLNGYCGNHAFSFPYFENSWAENDPKPTLKHKN